MHLNGLPKVIVKLILICPYYLVPDLLQMYSALKKSFISQKSDFFQATKGKKCLKPQYFNKQTFPFWKGLHSLPFQTSSMLESLISCSPNTCKNSNVC